MRPVAVQRDPVDRLAVFERYGRAGWLGKVPELQANGRRYIGVPAAADQVAPSRVKAMRVTRSPLPVSRAGSAYPGAMGGPCRDAAGEVWEHGRRRRRSRRRPGDGRLCRRPGR